MTTKTTDSGFTNDVTAALKRLEAAKARHGELTAALQANEAEQAEASKLVQSLLSPMLTLSTATAKPQKGTSGRFSPETRAKMAESQAARWAAKRAQDSATPAPATKGKAK